MSADNVVTQPTGLVIVDVQNAMVDIAFDSERVLAAIAELLANARASGADIAYIQHDHDDYGPMMPGHQGWRLHDAVRPRPDEPVFHKRGADCFDGTALHDHLQAAGVQSVVLAGMATEHCIEAATRSALDLGYALTLAGDAHTTARGDDVLIEMGLESRGGARPERIIAEHNGRWSGRETEQAVRVRSASEIGFAGLHAVPGQAGLPRQPA